MSERESDRESDVASAGVRTGSPFGRAVRRAVRRPGFVGVSVVLLLGAIGINAATSAMKLHFRKAAMDLRTADKTLGALPEELGTWVGVPAPQVMSADLIHELGTDKYIFRDYVNVAATGANGMPVATREEIKGLREKDSNQRFAKLAEVRSRNPAAVVSFAITYYTGKVDTVPHVPDRCYVADGFQPSAYVTSTWGLGATGGGAGGGAERRVPVRFIDFEDVTTRGAQNRCVAYFFHANGGYEDSPLEVRRKLQDLRERFGYFAKIEVMTVMRQRPGAGEGDLARLEDRDAAAKAMRGFLTAALPEVEKMLPDWDARGAAGAGGGR